MDKTHFRWTIGFKSGLWSGENSNFGHWVRIWVNSDNLSQLRRWGLCNISLEPPKHCEERPLFKLFTQKQLKKYTSALQQLFKAQQRSYEEKETDLHHNVYSEFFNYFLKMWNNYFSARSCSWLLFFSWLINIWCVVNSSPWTRRSVLKRLSPGVQVKIQSAQHPNNLIL